MHQHAESSTIDLAEHSEDASYLDGGYVKRCGHTKERQNYSLVLLV